MCKKKKKIVCAPNIPNFEEILYVDGFKANLINMSQICDKKSSMFNFHKICTRYLI